MEKDDRQGSHHKKIKGNEKQVSTDQTYRYLLLVILNEFGYLDKPLSEAENMTLREFDIKAEAFALHNERENARIAYQAWSNQQVQAVKQNGDSYEPVYPTFNDFYDSTKEKNKIRSLFEPDFTPELANGHATKTKTDIVYERAMALARLQSKKS